MKIFYIAQLFHGSTCVERAKILIERGWDVKQFDISFFLNSGSRISNYIQNYLLNGPDIFKLNSEILKFIKHNEKPDVVWIDKGRWLYASTIEKIKKLTGAYIVHYTPDPAFTVHTSRHFKEGLNLYDLCITTKRYEIEKYIQSGAKNVEFTLQGIDDRFVKCSHCANIEGKHRNGTIFIGHREPHYEHILSALANEEFSLKIWGPGWDKIPWRHSKHKRCVQGGPLWGDLYPKTLATARIGIGLLTKMCPDQFTTRTFEIPASGALLIAERNPEHQNLFIEGIEAEYFSSIPELQEKVKYFINNDTERCKIAKQGQKRALENYTWNHALKQIINLIENI